MVVISQRDISPELASKISEKIMPEVTAWQNRPLEAVYPHSQARGQRCIVHQIRSSAFQDQQTA